MHEVKEKIDPQKLNSVHNLYSVISQVAREAPPDD